MRALVTGASSEMRAVLRLLDRGHRVARPVVDDDQVDLIVDYRTTVQVKAAARAATGGLYRFELSASRRGPGVPELRADIYLFHAQDADRWWVVPRAEILRLVPHRTIGLSLTSNQASKYAPLREWLEAWHVFDAED